MDVMVHTDVMQKDILNVVGLLKVMMIVVELRIIQGEFAFHQLPS